MSAKLRKVSFFFSLHASPNNELSDRQLVRSFVLGTNVMGGEIIAIEERTEASGDIYFDIYVGKKEQANSRWLWKSYTPKISDIEREWEK